MELNLQEPINTTKQVLNRIESVVKDVSNLKEKHMVNNDEEYEKIKVIIEQLESKTKEVKLKMDNFNDNIDPVGWQKQNVPIENVNKKVEQYRMDFEQLKKGKLSHPVKY